MKKLLTLFVFMMVVMASMAGTLKRTIITTDGEIDDVDTYIRMLLYSNEFNIEGLIYSSSMWHYKGDGKGTLFTSEMEMTKKMYGAKTSLRWPGLHWMEPLLNGYEKIYPNLKQHSARYPTPAYLKSIVRVGNVDFEGEMEKVTPGSELIMEKLLDKNPQEIFLQAWGGTNTIARALKSIEEKYSSTKEWASIREKVSKKAIIYTILDQDATYKKYIAGHWPNIRVFYNSKQFWCMAYPWKRAVPKAYQPYFEGNFMGPNIILNHGPLLKQYYSYGDGNHQEGDDENNHWNLKDFNEKNKSDYKLYDFISEGDSPAFLQLVDMGLDNMDHPSWGGWGGRFVATKNNPYRFEDNEDAADFNPETNKMDMTYPQTRWLEAMQLDFAARANWCVKSFKEANHAPLVTIKEGNRLHGNANQTLKVNAFTSDPDNNKVQINAWSYDEVGSGHSIVNVNNNQITIQVPSTAKKGDVFHVIVVAKDNGVPTLTKYQRVLVTIK